jgi:hypothetical protein
MNMKDRGQALVNMPGSTAPQKDLTTVREVNHAVERNAMGGNYGVYCQVSGKTRRVTKVRTNHGKFEVRTGDGWIAPERVWKEG